VEKDQVFLGYWGLAGVNCVPGKSMGLCHRSGFDLRALSKLLLVALYENWMQTNPMLLLLLGSKLCFLFSSFGLFFKFLFARKFLTIFY